MATDYVGLLDPDDAQVDPARASPGAYSVLNLDLGTSRTDVDVLGSELTLRWVLVLVHDGADSAYASPDQYLRFGTNTDGKVPLLHLTPPDAMPIWEGRITGRVYLTNTAQSGKRLILVVGHE